MSRSGDLDRLSVLVVDDSAVAREALASILARDTRIRVARASDVPIARRKISQRRPDVVFLDLQMPGVHGLDFLDEIMRSDPLPVIVCSASVGDSSDAAIRALGSGAVEAISKAMLRPGPRGGDSALDLVELAWTASRAKLPTLGLGVETPSRTPPLERGRARVREARRTSRSRGPNAEMWAVGASTGGPGAIQTILEGLDDAGPGIVVAQHMAAGFTNSLATRLDRLCRPTVREARDGDRIERGTVLIAPGGHQTTVERTRTGGLQVRITEGTSDERFNPSVDVLFRSVARVVGARAVGIILTGMGNDGAAGLLEMRETGGLTIAQDEDSCVIFGMPFQAITAGAASAVLPLQQITKALERDDLPD